jgi:hypothetical protein
MIMYTGAIRKKSTIVSAAKAIRTHRATLRKRASCRIGSCKTARSPR